jgi:hypothetical protein
MARRMPALPGTRARYHQVRATLRGPGIAAVTVTCGWNATGKYLQCMIPTPRKVNGPAALTP